MAKPKVIKKPPIKRKPQVVVKKATAPAIPTIKPYVFQDCHHRTFLLLEEKSRHNRYLTVRDEEMQVIKLNHDLPRRDPSTGILIDQETTSTTDLHPVMSKDDASQPYDLKVAAQKMLDSLIVRTYDATKELCILLGKPVPAIPEEVQVARAAAAERLKAARAQRQSNLEAARSNNPQLQPNDKGNATMSTKKASKKTAAVKKTTVAAIDTRKITLLVKENPKRAGSDSHKRFSLYSKVKTVADFLKAGGTSSDISWDADHKFIKVSAA